MPQFPLNYLPGVVSDDTVLTKAGRYIDADKVRFVRADPGQPFRPQLIGGWERLTLTAITGVCRTVFAWIDNSGLVNIAFGTHSKLMVWRGGGLYDITPYGPPSRLGSDPLATTNTSATVTVTHTAHGYDDGISVRVYGAPALNGISADNLNGVHTISVIDADSYSFTSGSSDTASSTGSGGGDDIVVVPQTALPAGQTDGTGTAGWSTGGYGVGGYGDPSEDDYFPRTWSFGLLGQALVASPRNGAIYLWENDTSARASWLENSPLQVTAIMTTPERVVMALGCEEEASPHTFNARCIRHSDPGDETVWVTDTDTLAREKVLEGAGKLVAGRMAGSVAFIWTDSEAYLGEYVGALDEVYRFTRQGDSCGLIGPNAMAISGSTAYWMGSEVAFHVATVGSAPVKIDCPHRAELRENLAPSQRDKIVMTILSSFGEVWCFYPDSRDGLENSRALFFSTADGWWSKALLARTAACDAGPSDYPIAVDEDGNAYWHERGASNDGNAISWSLRAGPQYIDSAEHAIFLRAFWPDFKDQVGAITLNIYGREYPQSDDETLATAMMSPGSLTEKVDLHCEARIISWEITGNSGPASFRLGTPIVEGKATRRAK
jgi:hypothetical protein